MTEDARLARELTRYHFQDSDAWGPTPNGYFKVDDVLEVLAIERQRREALEQASGALVDAMCVNGEFYPVEIAEQAEALRALLPRVGGEG